MSATAQTRTIRIAHTSDSHSCIDPIASTNKDKTIRDKGGYLRRAAALSDLRSQGDNLLVLDCGDFSQGSVYYNLFQGDAEILLMNDMQYDACAIGNHEFDFGLDNLARLIRQAKFPFVCCNYDFTGTVCEGLVKPYIIIERAGVRVGILGVSPQPDGLVIQENYQPMRYIEPAKAAQPVIDLLRNKEKCDIVVCLSHLGWDEDNNDQEFIAKTKGLDILLGGHSHSFFEHPAFVRDASGREVLVDHEGKHSCYVGLLEVEVQ